MKSKIVISSIIIDLMSSNERNVVCISKKICPLIYDSLKSIDDLSKSKGRRECGQRLGMESFRFVPEIHGCSHPSAALHTRRSEVHRERQGELFMPREPRTTRGCNFLAPAMVGGR